MDARRIGLRANDIRNRLHLCPTELVGQCQHGALDDRRSGRIAFAGRIDARRRIGRQSAGRRIELDQSVVLEPRDYAGSPARIIGYANAYDFYNMWRVRPTGLRVIGAGYGSNPNLPGQVAHQYTDGQGYSPNLPQGAPPFGPCDMNSADGLTAQQFAAACGITTSGGLLMAFTDKNKPNC